MDFFLKKIAELGKNEIGILIKIDDFDKERLKIRLVNSEFILVQDGFIYFWELHTEIFYEVLLELEKRILEDIKIKKQIKENKKKRIEKETGIKTDIQIDIFK